VRQRNTILRSARSSGEIRLAEGRQAGMTRAAMSSAVDRLIRLSAASWASRVPLTNQRRISTACRLQPSARRRSRGLHRPPLGSEQPRHEQHGLIGCGEHGGVGDRIGHGRTSVVDICERTSLLPGSCVCPGHLAAIGVSPALTATDNTSLSADHALEQEGVDAPDHHRAARQHGRLYQCHCCLLLGQQHG